MKSKNKNRNICVFCGEKVQRRMAHLQDKHGFKLIGRPLDFFREEEIESLAERNENERLRARLTVGGPGIGGL